MKRRSKSRRLNNCYSPHAPDRPSGSANANRSDVFDKLSRDTSYIFLTNFHKITNHFILKTKQASYLIKSTKPVFIFLLFAELVFANTAERANPVFRYIVPSGTCCNAVIRVTCFGVINVAADIAYPFCHKFHLLYFNLIKAVTAYVPIIAHFILKENNY